jgi:hypothetical protein
MNGHGRRLSVQLAILAAMVAVEAISQDLFVTLIAVWALVSDVINPSKSSDTIDSAIMPELPPTSPVGTMSSALRPTR